MPLTEIPNSIVRLAVGQYCLDCGIVDEKEREYVAHLAQSLFDLGTTDLEGLLAGLEDAMGPCRRKT